VTRIEARFALSAFAMGDCPRWERAEVALAGRSNVGKSSLLNALAGSRGLARTSKTPGRTRCLNFFTIADDLALVDLPGYGFAKMSRAEAGKIAALLDEYLSARRNLAALVLLVDARRGPGQEEIALADTVRERGVTVIAAATKADKLRRSELAAALRRFAALQVEPILCSALHGDGIERLRKVIMACARKRS
jgi:GTP-binding protein